MMPVVCPDDDTIYLPTLSYSVKNNTLHTGEFQLRMRYDMQEYEKISVFMAINNINYVCMNNKNASRCMVHIDCIDAYINEYFTAVAFDNKFVAAMSDIYDGSIDPIIEKLCKDAGILPYVILTINERVYYVKKNCAQRIARELLGI